MLATGLIVAYGYFWKTFMAFYSGSTYKHFMMQNRWFGPYAVFYWTPSIPMLMMPLSSTSNSPNAASRIGVAIAIVEVRNASSIRSLRGVRCPDRRARKRIAEVAPRAGIEREQDENHHRLDHLHQHGRNALGALHRLRAVIECAKKNRGDDDAEWIEARDQRHRDRLETPSGRDFLVQAMVDCRDLHRATESRERAGERHRPDRERGDRDAKEIRRAAIFSHRTQLKPGSLRNRKRYIANARMSVSSIPRLSRVGGMNMYISALDAIGMLCGYAREASISGPCTVQLRICAATKFSMMVLMTSLVSRRARSHPQIPLQIAPPSAPAIRTIAIASGLGHPLRKGPTAPAAIAPITNCPSAPMLYSAAENATEIARPVNTSGVAFTRESVNAIQFPNAP